MDLARDWATKTPSRPLLLETRDPRWPKEPPRWLPDYDIFPTDAFVSVDTLPRSQCYQPKPHVAYWALDNGQLSADHLKECGGKWLMHVELHANLSVDVRCPAGHRASYGTAVASRNDSAYGVVLRDPKPVPSSGPRPSVRPASDADAERTFGARGVAWVYGQCDPLPGVVPPWHRALPGPLTRLRVRPYALPKLRLPQPLPQPLPRGGGGGPSKCGAAPFNVLFLVFDSTARTLFNRHMPRTNALLAKLQGRGELKAFDFRHSAVMGKNTMVNSVQMFGRAPLVRPGPSRFCPALHSYGPDAHSR